MHEFSLLCLLCRGDFSWMKFCVRAIILLFVRFIHQKKKLIKITIMNTEKSFQIISVRLSTLVSLPNRIVNSCGLWLFWMRLSRWSMVNQLISISIFNIKNNSNILIDRYFTKSLLWGNKSCNEQIELPFHIQVVDKLVIIENFQFPRTLQQDCNKIKPKTEQCFKSISRPLFHIININIELLRILSWDRSILMKTNLLIWHLRKYFTWI